MKAPAGQVAVGSRITIRDRTLNAGTGLAGRSVTAYYLTRPGARRLRLGGRSIKPLRGGHASTGSLTVSVPAKASGTYTVKGCADDGRQVGESHERNQCAIATRSLTVKRSGPLPPDTTPPSFAGAQSANPISTTAIALTWRSASDNRTPAGSIVYDVYLATSHGGENYGAAPTATSAAGALAITIGGLAPGRTYYFVVRARDASGNRSNGIVERSATTAPDTTAPVFAGLQTLSYAGTGCAVFVPNPTCHVVLGWNAATDDFTPAADIVYDIYYSTLSGHENFATPTFTSAAGATSYELPAETDLVGYFVVRARDAAGNHDSNTKEIQATPPP